MFHSLAAHGPWHGVNVIDATGPDAGMVVAGAVAMAKRLAAGMGASILDVASHDDAAADRAGLSGPVAVICQGTAGRQPARYEHQAKVRIAVESGIDAIERELSVAAPDSEFSLLAFSGMLDLVGEIDGPPVMLAGEQMINATGLSIFTSLSFGLFSRSRAQVGYCVNALEVAGWLNWKAILGEMLSGKPRRREGSDGHWPMVKCSDGHVVMVYQDRDWARLVDIVDDPELLPYRHMLVAARDPILPQINAVLRRWARNRTRAEVFARCQGHRIACGSVLTPDDLLSDATLAQRDFWTKTAEGTAASVPMLWNGKRIERLGLVASQEDTAA